MRPEVAASAVVARQLTAYNARDLEAFMACWASEARIYRYPDSLMLDGRQAIADRHRARFAEAYLRGELLHRSAVGSVVVDRERVTRTGDEGPVVVEVIAIYEVNADGLINAARMTEAV